MIQSIFSKIIGTIFKLRGWTIVGEYPQRPSVMVIAPHTSNWDFFIFLGLGIYWKRVGQVMWLGKHSIFIWPIAGLLRRLGGVSVDRNKNNNLISTIAAEMKKHPHKSYALACEGTRKYTDHWKKGFFRIAQKAERPITLAFVNYKDKEIGMGPTIDVPSEGELDWAPLHKFYKKEWAQNPDDFSDMKF